MMQHSDPWTGRTTCRERSGKMRVILGKIDQIERREYRGFPPFSMGELGVHIAEVPSSNLGAPTTLPPINQILSSRETGCSTVIRGPKVVPGLRERQAWRRATPRRIGKVLHCSVGDGRTQSRATLPDRTGPPPPLMSA